MTYLNNFTLFKFFALKTQYLLSFLMMSMMIFSSVTNAGSLKTDNSATALLNQYKALNKSLSNNQFKRPLVLNSTETSEQLKGEIYAVINYPFATVSKTLNNPENWCGALILHVNVKYCRAVSDGSGTVLKLNLGKKYDQELTETYPATFNYQEITKSSDYFQVGLKAAEGPLGTRDYQISVEAAPIKNNQTFLHFTYAYSFGFTGRTAMKSYLATTGKNKVGFTVASKQPDNVKYIKGVRGIVERNTMRYYLAIDAYLAGLNFPADKRFEKRLQLWFDSTEQYPRQLHEVEREDYFVIKRKEFARQNAPE
jgi:hypothetical protein